MEEGISRRKRRNRVSSFLAACGPSRATQWGRQTHLEEAHDDHLVWLGQHGVALLVGHEEGSGHQQAAHGLPQPAPHPLLVREVCRQPQSHPEALVRAADAPEGVPPAARTDHLN